MLFLGWGVVIFVTIGGAYYFCTGRPRKFTFTATDLGLALLLIYLVVHIEWIKPAKLHSQIVLQWFAVGTLYILLRRIEAHHRLILIIFLMFAAAAQGIYGNLQLYDIYPSYHSLFKLTGSFFNPGPYSGYLVSVLPIAVGVYLIKSSNFRVSDCLNVRLFDCLNKETSSPFIDSVIRRVYVVLKVLKVSVVSIIKRVSVALDLIIIRNFVKNRNIHPSEGSNSEAANISNLQTVLQSNREAIKPSNGVDLIRLIALITIISIVLVLPASRSRAAWLAAIISALYLFSATGKITELWHKLARTGGRKWLLNLVIAITALSATCGLYMMKKGSADGRVLIWKVTLNSIKKQPFLGHGIEKFKAYYMEDQAGYFKDHPGAPETVVAADNIYAFNEPLRITYETGLIGLALVLLIIWSAFRNDITNLKNQDSANLTLLSRAGLISVLIFGLFSYPAEIVPIMVNVIIYLTIISGGQQPIFTVSASARFRNPFLRILLTSAIAVTVILASQQLYLIYKAYTQWNQAYTTYSLGAYEDAVEEYEKIYPTLKDNGSYLINYGKALSMAGKHEKAIEILQQSKPFLTNTILYTALGDSYKATGQTAKAEDAYLHAWHMVPSRFYPKYLLAKLYDETGQDEKAVTTAKELLSKEVKIESTAVKEIQEDMRKIIEKSDSVIPNTKTGIQK